MDKATGKSEVPTLGVWKKVGNVAVAVNTADTRADLFGLNGLWPADSTPPAPGAKIAGSSGAAAIPVQAPGESLVLCLDNGKEIFLKNGVTIFGSDLGEAGTGSAQAVGQVQGHPTKKDTHGLVNLSTAAWTVTNSQGDRTTIPQGMTITLKDGLTILFGSRIGAGPTHHRFSRMPSPRRISSTVLSAIF